MIKKLLAVIIICVSSHAMLNAQMLTVTPTDTLTIDTTVSSCQIECILAYNAVNTSTDTLQMNWKVIYNTLPHNWSIGYCYKGVCLTQNIQGHTFQFSLDPGANGLMQLDVTPSSGLSASGYYQVLIWASNDSANTATVLTYKVNMSAATCFPAGITEPEMTQIFMYPNPVRNELKLSLSQSLSNGQIDIYNLIGSKVYSQSISSREITKDFDLSNLETGIYMARITDNGKIIATKKFTKED